MQNDERYQFDHLTVEDIAHATAMLTGEYDLYQETKAQTRDELWQGFSQLPDEERAEFWRIIGAEKLLRFIG